MRTIIVSLLPETAYNEGNVGKGSTSESQRTSAISIKTLMAATGALNGVPSRNDSALVKNSLKPFPTKERYSFVFEVAMDRQKLKDNDQSGGTRTLFIRRALIVSGRVVRIRWHEIFL